MSYFYVTTQMALAASAGAMLTEGLAVSTMASSPITSGEPSGTFVRPSGSDFAMLTAGRDETVRGSVHRPPERDAGQSDFVISPTVIDSSTYAVDFTVDLNAPSKAQTRGAVALFAGATGEPAVRSQNSFQVHFELGLRALEERNYAEVGYHFDKVLELKPTDALIHYTLWYRIRKHGDFEGAERYLRRAITPNSHDAHYHFRLSYSFELGDHFDRAQEYAQRATELDPDDSHYHRYLGKFFDRKGDLRAAMAQFDWALSLDDNDFLTHWYLANVLERLDDKARALKHRYRMIQLKPDSVRADADLQLAALFANGHARLAALLYESGKFEEAIHHYRLAAELSPAEVLRYQQLKRVLYANKGMDEIIPFLRNLLGSEPADANLHIGFADVLATTGRWDEWNEAVDHYQRALALEPNYVKAHYHLGLSFYNKNAQSDDDLDTAIYHFRRALEIDLKNIAIHCHLGLALYRRGHSAAAIAQFERAIVLNKDYIRRHYAPVFLALETGDRKRALAYLEERAEEEIFSEMDVLHAPGQVKDGEGAFYYYIRAMELEARLGLVANPNDAQDLNRLGFACCEQGNFHEATISLRRALELDPDNIAAHYNLGRALFELALFEKKGFEEAGSHFRRVIELDPAHIRAYYFLGRSLHSQENFPEAIDQFTRAIQLDPDYAEAYFRLGRAYSHLDRVDDAIQNYKAAIERNPDDESFHYHLGYAFFRRGTRSYDHTVTEDLALAQGYFARALEINPNRFLTHYHLGRLFYALNNPDQAIIHLRRAVELNSHHASSHHYLGWVLMHQGDLPGAIRSYRTALGLDSNDVQANYHLGCALDRQGRPGEAVTYYRRAAELNGRYRFENYYIALTLHSQGDIQAALGFYEQTGGRAPHSLSLAEHEQRWPHFLGQEMGLS